MSIKVDNHGTLDAVNVVEKKPDCKCDVSIYTEAAATVATAVVKATPDVDSPAPLHCQPCCLTYSIHTNYKWL